VRFKLALTENNPTIKTYDEAAWANVADTAQTPPSVAVAARCAARALDHPDGVDAGERLRAAAHASNMAP
jgi:hypothetical protein